MTTPSPEHCDPEAVNQGRLGAIELLRRLGSDLPWSSLGPLAQRVAQLLGLLSHNRHQVISALTQARRFEEFGAVEKGRVHLMKALADVQSNLSFRPQFESVLPTGFPRLTPVGETIVRRHAAYRLASTSTQYAGAGLERDGLLSLVQHAARYRLPLTLPVVTRYTGRGNRPSSKATMAVMYGPTESLPLGLQGEISVFVVSPCRVVSVGARGDSLMEVVQRTGPWLDHWLAQHQDRYVFDGPLRVLTYNTSSGRGRRGRYFEVERPIRPAQELSPDGDEMSLDGLW